MDSQGENWLHTGSVTCPRCSDLCQDCSREGTTDEVILKHICLLVCIGLRHTLLQDFYDKRENLGDCILQAENEAGNLLIGFLKEFGAGGFNLG